MELLMDIVRAIRNARAEYDVEAGHPVEAIIAAGGQAALLDGQRALLVNLARVNESTLTIANHLTEKPQQGLALVNGAAEVYLLVDLAAERKRLAKEIEETGEAITRSESLLNREGFRAKAPAQVVAREEERLAEHRLRLEKLQARLGAGRAGREVLEKRPSCVSPAPSVLARWCPGGKIA